MCVCVNSTVVDEFFVPALETIADDNNISNDVAGATLMAGVLPAFSFCVYFCKLYTHIKPNSKLKTCIYVVFFATHNKCTAGGSAPELFTSFIGTFQESDVGFGTIVGSAVFNVLFVIGCCTLASAEPLDLTWWPLFRDCVYYAISLGTLSIFFSAFSKEEIEWWEALILFLMYFGYVIFMKYNQDVYHWILRKQKRATQPSAETAEFSRSKTRVVLNEVIIENEENKGIVYRAKMLNILLKDKWDWMDVASVKAVNQIVGDVQTTFAKIDSDNSGYIESHEILNLLGELRADLAQVIKIKYSFFVSTFNTHHFSQTHTHNYFL